MKHILIYPACLAAALCFIACPAVAQQDDFPEVTVEGMHRVPESRMAVVYADPGADLSQYNRVKLLDAYVAFRKNWERDQRRNSSQMLRVTSNDVDKIKTDLAREFDVVFRKALEDGGYQVVDDIDDDVLLVRPAIINLDINAPDTPRAARTRTYTQSAGEMTLYIEIYDSVTGDMIAKAMDRKLDKRGVYTWSNAVTNKVAADKILKGWAAILVEALDEARQP